MSNELCVQPEKALWLVKPCNTVGCSVMIRVQVSLAASVHTCKWCHRQTDYNTDPSQARPILLNGPDLSKEEFGLTLYEAIKTIGGILVIDRHRANAIHRGTPQVDMLARRKVLQATLAQQLPLLTDVEMGQVLAKYPFVTGY